MIRRPPKSLHRPGTHAHDVHVVRPAREAFGAGIHRPDPQPVGPDVPVHLLKLGGRRVIIFGDKLAVDHAAGSVGHLVGFVDFALNVLPVVGETVVINGFVLDVAPAARRARGRRLRVEAREIRLEGA